MPLEGLRQAQPQWACRPALFLLGGPLFGYGAVGPWSLTSRRDTVFAFLVNSYGTVAIFVYVFESQFSQLRLPRRAWKGRNPARLRMRMWAYPYLTYLAIARHARHRSGDGLHPRPANAAHIRRHQSRHLAAGFQAHASGSAEIRILRRLRWRPHQYEEFVMTPSTTFLCFP
jgi:hypothetical protein